MQLHQGSVILRRLKELHIIKTQIMESMKARGIWLVSGGRAFLVGKIAASYELRAASLKAEEILIGAPRGAFIQMAMAPFLEM